MESSKASFRSVDEYIASFPPEVQERMEALRAIIHATAPGAQEKISYQMAAFDLNGNVVLFAGWKKHIGFYPAPDDVPPELQPDLSMYKGAKSALRLPFDKPLPRELIIYIVQSRVAENLRNAGIKAAKGT